MKYEVNEFDYFYLTRKKSGITLQEIADHIGCTKSLLSKFEHGQNIAQEKVIKYKQYILQQNKLERGE